MNYRWRIIRQQLTPSPGTVMLLLVALGLLVIGFGCTLTFVFTSPDVTEPLGSAALIISAFIMPAVVILVMIASLREKRPAARAVLWFLASTLVGIAGLIIAIGMAASPEVGVGGGGAFFFVFCAPIALALLAPAIYLTAKAVPQIRAALWAESERRAIEIIEARGELTIEELASDLGMSVEKVGELLDRLCAPGRPTNLLHRRQNRVYSNTALAEKQFRMVAIVAARAQIHIDELADEMGVTPQMIKDWIYDQVRRRRFTGYINWEDGMLYSLEAQKLGDRNHCPRCGGEMSLAGKGVIRCEFCGSEIFL